MAWEVARNRDLLAELPSMVEFPINRVRSTFLLTKDQIQKLKNHVSAYIPDLGQVSSFTVISAYVWICSERAAAAADEPVYFSFAADCRGHLDPSLPESYFGNCLVFVRAESKRGLLKKKDGFLIAAESIAEAIRRTLHSDDGVVKTADWPLSFKKLSGKPVVSVAGSPRFDVYEADFGWRRRRSTSSCIWIGRDRFPSSNLGILVIEEEGRNG